MPGLVAKGTDRREGGLRYSSTAGIFPSLELAFSWELSAELQLPRQLLKWLHAVVC